MCPNPTFKVDEPSTRATLRTQRLSQSDLRMLTCTSGTTGDFSQQKKKTGTDIPGREGTENGTGGGGGEETLGGSSYKSETKRVGTKEEEIKSILSIFRKPVGHIENSPPTEASTPVTF